MLYPHNADKTLEKTVFQNPGAEYRATPFWAWNAELSKEELTWQIEVLKKMGMGGFHMHSRTGMATPYLSDEFMQLVRACVDKAKDENMLAWLYDEDRWPSGAAGGLVTKDEQYRARHLLFTPVSNEEYGKADSTLSSSARAARANNGRLLGRYFVALNPDGSLREYGLLQDGQCAPQGARLWYAYLEVAQPSPWYNNQTYVNTLDKAAIERFVQITYEGYKKAVGGDFGGAVPAIFTDEPQFTHKTTLGFAGEEKDVALPWTDDFAQSYAQAYGEDILAKLPELYWELPGGEVSVTRYRYHDHVAERFASAFADTCGQWCRQNGIMLTGHMMEEPTLQSQTAALGDAMRSYRSFGLPGIDMLCDYREYTTAKQAQSATNQFGYPGVLSELYGVTNWNFDFRGHKLAGDWQAALGVTVRVPHLSWVSMGGEAKRDYPASIHYQSPWHERYPMVEDHFARLNTALTRGKSAARVGVLHPVESYWLHWGPKEQTAQIRSEMDERFQSLCDWLLFGLIDFDYICESLLPIQNEKGDNPFTVGQMRYDVLLVPGMETMRLGTVERLEDFVAAGGRLIFLGEPAKLVDAVPSGRVQALFAKSEGVEYARGAVMDALADVRLVDVRDEQGQRTGGLLTQMRLDGEDRWLFVCHGRHCDHPDVLSLETINIYVQGQWHAELYDTMTGEIYALPSHVQDGQTVIPYGFYGHDSLLLRLSKQPSAAPQWQSTTIDAASGTPVRGLVDIELSEPNVLLLDVAEFAFDDGQYQAAEELLRADNLFREHLGYPSRMEAVAQPWVVEKETISHHMRLRFAVESKIPLCGAKLALEEAEQARVLVNGEEVEMLINGWFVDKAIKTISLPTLHAGTNTIEVIAPFSKRIGVEWMYLLGNFSVELQGTRRCLSSPVTKLGFGDWCTQGLPYYCGNVRYKIPFTGQSLQVKASHYKGALMVMDVDGKNEQNVAFAPYSAAFDGLTPGGHTLGITVYGNRVNGFGCVHNADETTSWFGPNCWRTQGDSWCYEYRLKQMGLLTAPRLQTK